MEQYDRHMPILEQTQCTSPIQRFEFAPNSHRDGTCWIHEQQEPCVIQLHEIQNEHKRSTDSEIVEQLRHAMNDGQKLLKNVMIQHEAYFKYYALNLEHEHKAHQLESAAVISDQQKNGHLCTCASMDSLKVKPQRCTMTFDEFLRISSSPIASPCYLYGEPVSEEDMSSASLNTPDILSQVSLTSTLLWAGFTHHNRVSPMHYDLAQGLIRQLLGTKRIILAPPLPHFYTLLRPHATTSEFDRQSSLTLSEIRHLTSTESLLNNHGFKYVSLNPGEALYIPFGWWHHIESTGPNISVTYRWDTFGDSLRKATLMRHHMLRLGCVDSAAKIYKSFLSSLLPGDIVDLLMCRLSS